MRAETEISVLIVDDEPLMRSGLRLMVDGVRDIRVVGEAGDGAEALSRARTLRPTVVLMDIRMPRVDGIDAVKSIRAAGVDCAVVMLTAFDTDHHVIDALQAGAVSFLLKDSAPERVVDAVVSAAVGEARFSPDVLRRLVGLAGSGRRAPEGLEVPAPSTVSSREWDVAQAVARGLTNQEIADQLYISVATVKTHLARLYEKLEVTNRVQLAITVLGAERTRPA